MAWKLLTLALAGGVGTLARFGVASFVQGRAGSLFPWGTLAANLIGCFLAGVLWSLTETRFPVSPETRTLVFIGFLGAFTTFSAFMLENSQLLRDGRVLWLVGNLALQNTAGLLLVCLGLLAGRWGAS